MFYGCKNLKGANEYQSGQDGIEYANYQTGYFTNLVGKNGDEKIGAVGETLTAENLTLDDDKDFVANEPFTALQPHNEGRHHLGYALPAFRGVARR